METFVEPWFILLKSKSLKFFALVLSIHFIYESYVGVNFFQNDYKKLSHENSYFIDNESCQTIEGSNFPFRQVFKYKVGFKFQDFGEFKFIKQPEGEEIAGKISQNVNEENSVKDYETGKLIGFISLMTGLTIIFGAVLGILLFGDFGNTKKK